MTKKACYDVKNGIGKVGRESETKYYFVNGQSYLFVCAFLKTQY